MFDKLDEIVSRFEELEARLAAPGLYDDPDAAAKLLRERSELEPVVLAYRSMPAKGAGGAGGSGGHAV